MSSIDFFNDLARKTNTYLNTGRRFSFDFKVFQKTFKDINKKINISSDNIVLDLGGGCGQITKYIAGKCKQVVLADGVEEALKVARNKLKNYSNISYKILDINNLPLSFPAEQFDKVVCYSVVHYLESFQVFGGLIHDLLRITKPKGKILIGDIPLSEKYRRNLEERKKHFVKNFILNQKYYFKKYITNFFYKIMKIDINQVKGLNYTKETINNILSNFDNINYKFLEQDKKLPFADSRKDLLIFKK